MEPREFRVAVNGIDHHVIAWGRATDRPPAVLCHGFLDLAWSWDAVARTLAADREVFAFDWRGHGSSSWVGAGGYYHFADYVLDLDLLLPALAPRPVHLVGHSMGGTAVTLFAAARPVAIRSIATLEGMGPRDTEPSEFTPRFRNFLDNAPKCRARKRSPIPTLQDALRRMQVQNPDLPEALGMFLAEKATRPVIGGYEFTFDPLHQTTSPTPFRADMFRAFLREITAPALFMAGTRGFRTADERERLACLRNLTVCELEGVGHMMHWMAPGPVAEHLSAFFAAHD